ncbi:excalibur calcium-binding domain-containing protein [Escherichia coli]|nr:excalibur calcium-binding domain-containing protein [Escherichia coli]
MQSTTSGWSYRNCTDARRAGAAPLRRGTPGYGVHMDGDGDGVACEPYSR